MYRVCTYVVHNNPMQKLHERRNETGNLTYLWTVQVVCGVNYGYNEDKKFCSIHSERTFLSLQTKSCHAKLVSHATTGVCQCAK